MKKIFLTLIISALTASGIMAQNNSEPATMDVNSYQGVNSALTHVDNSSIFNAD